MILKIFKIKINTELDIKMFIILFCNKEKINLCMIVIKKI